jgi:hypothetical protein
MYMLQPMKELFLDLRCLRLSFLDGVEDGGDSIGMGEKESAE